MEVKILFCYGYFKAFLALVAAFSFPGLDCCRFFLENSNYM